MLVRDIHHVSINVSDADRALTFYRDLLGLPVLEGNYSPHIVFFEIAAGVAGHTTVLALFGDDSDEPVAAGDHSSLHHFALSIPWQQQSQLIDWYDRKGIKYEVRDFEWIGWRGVFTHDPEGNLVEIVAWIPDLQQKPVTGTQS